MRDEYREEMAKRPIPIHRQDFDIDNFLTTLRQYYHGGRFDFLLNSKENIDLLNKRFVVFEIDNVKDNKELFPVVTIIIMEAFINKMWRLKGIPFRRHILLMKASMMIIVTTGNNSLLSFTLSISKTTKRLLRRSMFSFELRRKSKRPPW